MQRLLLILGVALAALGVTVSSAAGPSAPSGEIAYLQTKGKIYVISATGSEPQKLLAGSAMGTFNWSPDGRLIAFTAGPWRESPETVVRISTADGTLVRNLPLGPLKGALAPTWSPDGRQLAFAGFDLSAGFDLRSVSLSIYVINADGTGLRRLTRHKSLWDENPDWSPDGRWIAFERYNALGSNFSASSDVMAVRPNGTGLHRIARVINGPQCACPDWSPDGSKITYQASPTAATSKYPEIFVMNADGTSRTQLTFTGNRVRDENPDWSPDGKWIAFYSERVGNAEIYVIGADGRHLTRVTHDPAYVMYPRWRPTR